MQHIFRVLKLLVVTLNMTEPVSQELDWRDYHASCEYLDNDNVENDSAREDRETAPYVDQDQTQANKFSSTHLLDSASS